MKEPLPRLDGDEELRRRIMPLCRLKPGEIWEDRSRGHRVGCIDATAPGELARFFDSRRPVTAINDPPYNITVGSRKTPQLFSGNLKGYLSFTRKWVAALLPLMADKSHFYLWLGADQKEGFQPLPDVMVLLRQFENLRSRSFITLRNQRGYGTRKNWMCARQELLYYTLGDPPFQRVYTEIPKLVRGYYKSVGGKRTENLERGESPFIRPGNVWVDVQQVFYRMEENVPGAYAQKPLKAITRILEACSSPGDVITDLFSHSGTTLLASEILGRRCITADVDPVFAELTIRRLEYQRTTGRRGWQCRNPFPELEGG